MLTAAVGIPTSTPATAILVMILPTPDRIARVIDHSLQMGSQKANPATRLFDRLGIMGILYERSQRVFRWR
jgi:hypothetical protein